MSNLPPDPDGMNTKRADWAESALVTFRHKTGTDKEDCLCDMLADLMHWCDRYGLDFDTEEVRARYHYEAETRSAARIAKVGWA